MAEHCRIPFVKMQGVGNHFVVVDGREGPQHDWQSLAPRLCAERFGIGADGPLVVAPSPEHDARMLMYNPDGSEDFCGNGLRCVARYVSGERDANLVIDTLAGPRHAAVRFGEDGICVVTVEMGQPSFDPADVPALMPHAIGYTLLVNGRDYRATTLSTGTAHTILFVDELPGDSEFLAASPLIENHPTFPDRTSVMWAKAEERNRLKLRIWERGAGETWGCGTGACAAAVAAIRQGLAESPVTVASKGGELRIEWTDGTPIRMTGPAEYVFRGDWPLPAEPRQYAS
jgi:diaminopimelate epimerase